MLVLYRCIVSDLGPSQLGVWSLVSATASMTRILEIGICASVVRYVAKYQALNQFAEASSLIETAIISLGATYAVVLVCGYPGMLLLLRQVVPSSELTSAQNLLPFSLLYLWIAVISGILSSALDGLGKTYLRSIATTTSNVLLVGGSFVSVPHYGLVGVVMSQLGAMVLTSVFMWIHIRRTIPELGFVPYRANLGLLRETMSYGLSTQAISIMAMLFDPTTKLLMVHFGGLSVTGYYEAATRVVLAGRSLILAPSQAAVAFVSRTTETAAEDLMGLYQMTQRIIVFLSALMFSIAVACAPVLVIALGGAESPSTGLFMMILSAAWFVNTITAPAYFVNMGTGQLKWNVVSHGAIGLMNLVLGWIGGSIYGGQGVIFGWCIALAVGSLVVPMQFHAATKVQALTSLIPVGTRVFCVWCLVSISVLLSFKSLVSTAIGPMKLVTELVHLCVFLAIVLVPAAMHPMARTLRNQLLRSNHHTI